jgi:hypothetical protein
MTLRSRPVSSLSNLPVLIRALAGRATRNSPISTLPIGAKGLSKTSRRSATPYTDMVKILLRQLDEERKAVVPNLPGDLSKFSVEEPGVRSGIPDYTIRSGLL